MPRPSIERVKTYKLRLFAAGCLLAVMIATNGCRETADSRLVGRWEGRPDSAAAFVARRRAADTDTPNSPATPIAPPFSDTTALQQYDLHVVLELGADRTATMWRDEHGQRLAGHWRVVENNGDRMVVEIAAQREGQQPTIERRRFQLEWEDDRRGFTLREEGADPQLGWLFFQRAGP